MISQADLVFEMARRRVIERYIGSFLRPFWIFFAPLLPVLTSVLIFYFIAKVPEAREMGIFGYAIFLFAAILPYRMFQRALGDGANLLVENMDLMKSVSVPVSHLALTTLGVLFFEFAIQICFLFLLILCAGMPISLNLLLLPVAIILLVFLCIGAAWLASIVGYFFRDVNQVLDLVLAALIYLTPAMYPLTVLPEGLRAVALYNPLTHLVIVFRDTLIATGDLHPLSWLVVSGCAAIFFCLGWLAIRRIQSMVGDLV